MLSVSLVKARKTIKAKILELRKGKEELLKREYENFQRYLHGDKLVPLYSATRQQADRFLRRIKGKIKEDREYPMILRRDIIKLVKRDTKLTPYWFRVPVYGKKGGIWVPVRPHEEIEPSEWSIRESKIIRRGEEWFVYIVVEKEVEEPRPSSKIIAIDIGDKNIATKVELDGGRIGGVKFYGREVRGIRRHYDWLRRRLGEKKLLGEIRRIGSKERRKVNDILHKISREVVERARDMGATIVIGDLEGIRRRDRGRTLNRIVNRMPYYKLTRFIEYKAAFNGVPVIRVKENNTSKTCHRCNSIGIRKTQGLFYCPNCNLQYNADLNGAINIGRVALGYMPRGGAALTRPITPSEASPPMPRRLSGGEAEIGESPGFSRGECQPLVKTLVSTLYRQ
jgi:putative transposase